MQTSFVLTLRRSIGNWPGHRMPFPLKRAGLTTRSASLARRPWRTPTLTRCGQQQQRRAATSTLQDRCIQTAAAVAAAAAAGRTCLVGAYGRRTHKPNVHCRAGSACRRLACSWRKGLYLMRRMTQWLCVMQCLCIRLVVC